MFLACPQGPRIPEIDLPRHRLCGLLGSPSIYAGADGLSGCLGHFVRTWFVLKAGLQVNTEPIDGLLKF
ncbi:hypothetical protein QWA68_016642 [Fusarium oxysporum]|nr:hypothetical protein QWA68_016642 [Fusarium oxysporum]